MVNGVVARSKVPTPFCPAGYCMVTVIVCDAAAPPPVVYRNVKPLMSLDRDAQDPLVPPTVVIVPSIGPVMAPLKVAEPVWADPDDLVETFGASPWLFDRPKLSNALPVDWSTAYQMP